MSGLIKLSQKTRFISALSKISREEKVIAVYKNMMKMVTLSDVLSV